MKSSLQELYGLYHELVDCYKIFISQMSLDLLPFTLISYFLLALTWLSTRPVFYKKQDTLLPVFCEIRVDHLNIFRVVSFVLWFVPNFAFPFEIAYSVVSNLYSRNATSSQSGLNLFYDALKYANPVIIQIHGWIFNNSFKCRRARVLLLCLCLFAYNDVCFCFVCLRLCCLLLWIVFYLIVPSVFSNVYCVPYVASFLLCTLCCQLLWIVYYLIALRCSLTCIVYPMLPVALDCLLFDCPFGVL